MDLTLPGSEDCYGKYVVSQEVERISANEPECIMRKRKGLRIAPDQYAILKKALYKNCIMNECKQAVKVIDDLVITVDSAVEKVYGKGLKK